MYLIEADILFIQSGLTANDIASSVSHSEVCDLLEQHARYKVNYNVILFNSYLILHYVPLGSASTITVN